MELNECLTKRRSVHKFSDKEISPEVLPKIVKAGIQSPNAGNLQSWRFVVVTDDTQKEKIAQACEDQTWIMSAPSIIVVCTDNRDLERFYGVRGKNVYAIQDAAAAAENMALKATELGLGSCWVGAFDEDLIKSILMLPAFVTPHIVFVLGYAAEKPAEKQRLKIEDLIHLNQYGKRAVEYPEMGELIKKIVEKGKKAIRKK